MLKKTAKLRRLLESSSTEFILEAHNGISAKIVEDAGFKGIWASGLALSAQYGVRDNNEASWTQILEMVEFMSDATSVPILLDGDTGYGNFNNLQRLVKKLEQRQVAGVCIEDKVFPKKNSFIKGRSQPLADIDEFCGKIKAGKDAQLDDDFIILARVEAFIAGWGLSEALKRAEAYHNAGADGILIHSALYQPKEILSFKKSWGGRCPVVIVPTKYYSTPTEVFQDHQFSLVIWANHMLRASIQHMQKVSEKIYSMQCVSSIESDIAPVSKIFELQGEKDLQKAEQLYLPCNNKVTKAIILAASQGKELGELTIDKPKAMVDVGGKPLLERITDVYRSAGIKEIHVVRGYRYESINFPSLIYADNHEFATTNELNSFDIGLKNITLNGDLICSYGDVIFNKNILNLLSEFDDDFVIPVDIEWKTSRNKNRLADYVECTSPYSRRKFFKKSYLNKITQDRLEDNIHGEWMGLIKFSKQGHEFVIDLVKNMKSKSDFLQMGMPELINQIVQAGKVVRVLYMTGHWMDVDSIDDVIEAGQF